MVAGWRQGRHDNKVFASGIYNFVSRLLFGVQAHDMNWIKAFRREVVDDLPLRSDWHRFVLMIAADKGYQHRRGAHQLLPAPVGPVQVRPQPHPQVASWTCSWSSSC